MHCALNYDLNWLKKYDVYRYMQLHKTDLSLKTQLWLNLLNLYKIYFTPKNHHKK